MSQLEAEVMWHVTWTLDEPRDEILKTGCAAGKTKSIRVLKHGRNLQVASAPHLCQNELQSRRVIAGFNMQRLLSEMCSRKKIERTKHPVMMDEGYHTNRSHLW